MMIDRIEGNAELKKSVRMMLDSRRMTHSLLLVGEEGLGAGFAARCVAADYLYPRRRSACRGPAAGRVLPRRGQARRP